MQENELSPSSRFIAKAIPRRTRFMAQFAIPGLRPEFVQRGGEAALYDTKEEAEAEAAVIAVRIANERIKTHRPFTRTEVMPPEDLAATIEAMGMTSADLAELFQSPHVGSWLNGDRRVPHMAKLLLLLMREPANKELIAKEISR